MPVKTLRGEKRRRRRESHGAEPHSAAPVAAPEQERRDRDPAQDLAVYHCQCGLVFSAPVCTSVDCPHCGGPQAW